MATDHKHAAPKPGEAAPVELALEQSKEVKEKVEECAEEISATNAVVQAKIAEGATTVSAPNALVEGRKIEAKIQEVAGDLHGVTETLARGIEELKQLEADLSRSRTALSESNTALAASTLAENEARHRSLHDASTGLPNRDLFDVRFEQAVAMAKRHGWTLAVMFFDLDHFKSINDTHGHAAGDVVLREVATRLSDHAREEDTVCRNGGDEFLYLLVDPHGRHNIERIAKSVLQRVNEPVAWADTMLDVKASVGVAVYPRDGNSGEELVRSADAAMYAAKRQQSGFVFAETLAALTAV